jgi:hypothetical protein
MNNYLHFLEEQTKLRIIVFNISSSNYEKVHVVFIVTPYSAPLLEGQWFSLSCVSCPTRNFHGKDVCFSLISWVKRKETIDNECE